MACKTVAIKGWSDIKN